MVYMMCGTQMTLVRSEQQWLPVLYSTPRVHIHVTYHRLNFQQTNKHNHYLSEGDVRRQVFNNDTKSGDNVCNRYQQTEYHPVCKLCKATTESSTHIY